MLNNSAFHKRRKKTTLTHKWNHAFENEQMTLTREKTKERNSEICSVSNPKDEGSCLSWIGDIFPSIGLKEILALAKQEETSHEITKKNLDYVIYCLRYKGLLPLTSIDRLKKISVRILSYLAQNRWGIPDEAIDLLIDEVQLQNKSTLNNAILAIAHAVHNGHNLKISQQEIFIKGIIQLIKLDKLYYFQTIIIAIAAAKDLNLELISENKALIFQFLKFACLGLTDEEVLSLYPKPIENKGFAENSNSSVFRTLSGELKNFKNLSKDKIRLSEEDLIFSVSRWDVSDSEQKTKISWILMESVFNGQLNVADIENLSKLLSKALISSERKIQNHAIFTIGYLVKNKKFNLSEALKIDLDNAQKEQRKYALKTFIYLLNSHNSLSSDKKEWLQVLENLIQNQDKTIRHDAQYALMKLTGKMDYLSDQIFDKNQSVKISGLLVQAATAGNHLSKKIVENLAKILTQDYCNETKHNAMLALSYVCENKQILSKNIISIIINHGLKSNQASVRKSSFTAIGYYSKNIPEIFNENIISNCMFENIKQPETCESALFLATRLLDIKKQRENKENVNKIALLVSEQLKENYIEISNTSDILQNKNLKKIILYFLKKAYENNSITNGEVLKNLGLYLIKEKDKTMKHLLLSVIGTAIEKIKVINFQISVLDELIRLLDSEYFTDAAQVLNVYIKKTSTAISEELIGNIAELNKHEEKHYNLAILFKQMTKKQWAIGENSKKAISQLVSVKNSGFLQLALDASLYLTKYQSVDQNFFDSLLGNLNSSDEQILETLLTVIKQTINKNYKENKKLELNESYFYKLLEITKNSYFSKSIKEQALYCVCEASKLGRMYTQSTIKNLYYLTEDKQAEIENVLKKNILQAIERQIPFYKIFIKRNQKNNIFIEILNKIENTLKNNELCEESLNVLLSACKCGYKVTEKGCVNIAKILACHSNSKLRETANKILSILSLNNTYELPSLAKDFYEQEKHGADLASDVSKKQLLATEAILKIVNRGDWLTIKTIQNLHEALNKTKSGFDKKIKQGILKFNNKKIESDKNEFGEEIKLNILMILDIAINTNRQRLDYETQGIFKKLLENKKEKHSELIIKCISGMCSQGEYVDDDILYIFEERIIQKKVLNKKICETLLTGIIRNYKISKETLLVLFEIISSFTSSKEIKKQAISLIIQTLKNEEHTTLIHEWINLNKGNFAIKSILQPLINKMDEGKNNNLQLLEKDRSTLIIEISEDPINETNRIMEVLLKDSCIKSILQQTDTCFYENKNKQTPSGYFLKKPVKDWDISCIKDWAAHIKNKTNNIQFLPEILAILQRACLLFKGYKPRNTQMLALLMLLGKELSPALSENTAQLLQSHETKGCIAQIATGEGKSMIIAMLAVVKCLQGETTDIITNSEINAKRDADEHQSFFEMFNLKAASNEDNNYSHGTKLCYEKGVDIIYGSSSNFQYDILREEYAKLNTRGKRKLGCVIVDEADYFLIDEAGKIAMLSEEKPGFNYLDPVFLFIWQQLQNGIQRFTQKEGKFFFVEIDGLLKAVNIDCDAFLTERIISATKQVIGGDSPKISVPTHLKNLVTEQISTWVAAAMYALCECKIKQHYTIIPSQNGLPSIEPVDNENTGVIQRGTRWSDGLQQFLQIKHGLPLAPISYTSNYLSNLSFIKRYGNKLYGLTGTLGLESSQRLMQEVYNANLVSVPQYKEKKFERDEGDVIADGTETWLNQIKLDVSAKIEKKRAVLVLCNTEEAAELVKKKLLGLKKNIITYIKDNENSSSLFLETVDCETIIVATNLAGRATDIRLSEAVIANGGLHVCTTFLPKNSRVEEQAMGRGGRKGEPGSGRLIINTEDVEKQLNLSSSVLKEIANKQEMNVLKQFREQQEIEQLENFKTKELLKLNIKNKLFEKYCGLLEELQMIDDKETDKFYQSLQKSFIGKIAQSFGFMIDMDRQYKRDAVEEKWSLWLQACDLADEQKSLDEFNQFADIIRKEYEKDDVIKNPSYYIQKGNAYLERSNTFTEILSRATLREKALESFNKAIKLDPTFAFIAYYHRAYALIQLEKGEDYKLKALQDLQKFCNILKEHLMPLQQSLIQSTSGSVPSLELDIKYHYLENQLSTRLQVYTELFESASKGIEDIKKSMKLLHVKVHEEKSNIVYENVEKIELDNILSKYNQKDITLTFNHLHVHDDITTDFQAFDVFKSVSKKFEKEEDCKAKVYFNSWEISNKNSNDEIVKLLPINHNVEEIKTEEEKEEPSQEKIKNDTKESVDFIEHVVEIGKFLKDNIYEPTVEFISDCGNKIIQKKEEFEEEFKSLFYNYEILKLMPVKIIWHAVELNQSLKDLQDFNETDIKCNITYKSAPKAFIEFVLDQQNSFKIVVYNIEQQNTSSSLTTTTHKTKIKHADQLSENCDIKFSNLSITEAEFLFKRILQYRNENNITTEKMMPDIQLVLKNVKQELAADLLKKYKNNVSLAFLELDYEKFKSLAYFSESEFKSAQFKFQHINSNKSETFSKNLDLKTYDLNVEHQLVDQAFNKFFSRHDQLLKYKQEGFLYVYTVNELSPMPIKSLALLAVLAGLQLAAAACLLASSSGACLNLSVSLFSDVLNDLFRLGSGIYNRKVDLMSYIWQKSLSLSLALYSFGTFPSDTAVAQIATEIVDNSVEKGTTSLLANLSNNVAQQVTTTHVHQVTYHTVQSQKSNLAKSFEKILMHTIKTTSKHCIEETLKKTSELVLSETKNKIIQHVKKEILIKFADPELKNPLNKIFAVSNFLERPNLRELLESKINYRNSMDNTIFDIESVDIHCIENFTDEFKKQVENIYTECFCIEKILLEKLQVHFGIKLEIEDIKYIVKLLQNKNILINQSFHFSHILKNDQVNLITSVTDVSEINLEKLDLEKFNSHKEEILEACIEFDLHCFNDYPNEIESLKNQAADLIAKKLVDKVSKYTSFGTSLLNTVLGKAVDQIPEDPFSSSNNPLVNVPPMDDKLNPMRHQHNPPVVVVETRSSDKPNVIVVSTQRPNTSTYSESFISRNNQSNSQFQHKNLHGHGSKIEIPFKLDSSRSDSLFSDTKIGFIDSFPSSVCLNVGAFSMQEILEKILKPNLAFVEKQKLMDLATIQMKSEIIKNDHLLLNENRKFIKTIIQFILVIKKEFQQQNHSINHAEVKQQADIIYNNSKTDNDEIHFVSLQKQLAITENHESFIDYLKLLENLVGSFNKTRRNIMQDMIINKISQIDINSIGNSIFGAIEDRNYDQVSLLMKEGKLGPAGFFAGTLLNGVLNAQKESSQNHYQMQVRLTKLAEILILKQNEFMMEALKVDQRRIEFLDKLRNGCEENLKQAIKLEDQAIEFMTKGKEEFANKLLNRAKEKEEAIRDYSKNMAEVAKSNGIDPEFLNKCVEAHKMILDSMFSTVKELGKQESGTLECLIKESKSLIEKAFFNEDNKESVKEIKESINDTDKNNSNILSITNEKSEKKSIPEWKQKVTEANDLYYKGKAVVKMKKGQEGADLQACGFFSQSKKIYKNLKNNGEINIDNESMQVIDKRLEKLGDEGKYAPSKLSSLCK